MIGLRRVNIIFTLFTSRCVNYNYIKKYDFATSTTEEPPQLYQRFLAKKETRDPSDKKSTLHELLNPNAKLDRTFWLTLNNSIIETKLLIIMRILDRMHQQQSPAKTNAYNQFFSLLVDNIHNLRTDLHAGTPNLRNTF
jgi:hypothetical protein